MNKRSVPLDRKKGIGTRRKNFEKDLSTQQHLQKKNTRIQAPHADQERPADPEKKARQGKKAADRLIREHLDLKFPRLVRVRSRADYLKIQRSGRKMGGRYLIILSMDNDLPASRFGITVSRKTGNAVTRNRVKRRIRELQRLNRDSVVPGKDIVVVATRNASAATFEKMKMEYANLITRAGLVKEPLDQ
jgi:ribonuclease P protein component